MGLTVTVPDHDVPPLPPGLRSTARRRVANELNTTAIHTLRRARVADTTSGLSPERLSLLSVLVYAGPRTMGQLARAEQVSRPAITRIVTALEDAGLAERAQVAADRRSTLVTATASGRAAMHGATPAELDLVSRALTVVRRGLRG